MYNITCCAEYIVQGNRPCMFSAVNYKRNQIEFKDECAVPAHHLGNLGDDRGVASTHSYKAVW